MRKLLIAFLLLFFIKPSFAQTKDTSALFRKNIIYAEWLGNSADYYSINYERFFNAKNLNSSFRIGFCWSLIDKGVNFPMIFTGITGKKSNHFEFGLGFLTEFDSVNPSGYISLTSMLGYRFQKPNGHFIFKIDYTPIISNKYYDIYGEMTLIRYGISIGYCF